MLLASDFAVTKFNKKHGEVLSKSGNLLSKHHCHYYGKVEGLPNSKVRLSSCDSLRGKIEMNDELYMIRPYKNHHVFFKPIDNPLYHQHINFNDSSHHKHVYEEIQTQVRRKRDVDSQNNDGKMFIELMLVTDNNVWHKFNEDEEAIKEDVFQIVNYADEFFTQVNVRPVLTHLHIFEDDPYVIGDNANTEYDNFKAYQYKRISGDKDPRSPWKRADVIHLVYGDDFAGTTIGLAAVSGICVTTRSVGIIQHHTSPLLSAAVLTHELGHNLGLRHIESNSCQCTDGVACIMYPSLSNTGNFGWSRCSRSSLGRMLPNKLCIHDTPRAEDLYTAPKCGNNIVERGEECDCGTVDDCDSKCCNASTCQLLPRAECDGGECCDGCLLRPSGHVCRGTGVNECDLPEYCNGFSSSCPHNSFMENGRKCNGNRDYCVGGSCRNRDLQCKEIFGGDSRKAPDTCYDLNLAGSAYGSCGDNVRCAKKDVMCGKIFCTQPATKVNMQYNIYCDGIDHTRYSTIYELENYENQVPGLVEDFTSCGKDKWCVDNKCVDFLGTNCSNKCHGNGICNNRGNCHCIDGFAPPYCDLPGHGGSLDSGPISPQGVTKDVVLMLVLFLFVMPVILSGGVYVWYKYLGGSDQVVTWKQNRQERLAAVAEMEKQKKRQKNGGRHQLATGEPLINKPPVVRSNPTNKNDEIRSSVPTRTAPRPPAPTYKPPNNWKQSSNEPLKPDWSRQRSPAKKFNDSSRDPHSNSYRSGWWNEKKQAPQQVHSSWWGTTNDDVTTTNDVKTGDYVTPNDVVYDLPPEVSIKGNNRPPPQRPSHSPVGKPKPRVPQRPPAKPATEDNSSVGNLIAKFNQ